MPGSLNSSEGSIATGFQDWPEYSEAGDWLELECNAGVPLTPTAPQRKQNDHTSLSSPSGSSPPAKKLSIAVVAISVKVSPPRQSADTMSTPYSVYRGCGTSYSNQ